MKLKIQLEKEQADVHTYLKEKSKLFSEFESSRSDLKLLYHFFSDERFKFLKYILDKSHKDQFLALTRQVFSLEN